MAIPSGYRTHSAVLLAILAIGLSCIGGRANASGGHPVSPASSLCFEKNVGQAARDVRFVAHDSRFTLLLRDDGATFRGPGAASAGLTWRGAAASSRFEAGRKLPVAIRYYHGSDRSRWQENVTSFERIRQRNLYPGVDLVFYGRPGHMEYDFVVQPGADPKRIAFSVGGASPRLSASGDLILGQASDAIRFRKPVSYQETARGRRLVGSKFVLSGREVRMAVGAYDRTKPLVIDPVVVYSTLLVPAGNDGVRVQVDASGYTTVAGRTSSLALPVQNAAQPAYGGGIFDLYVMRLDPNGALLYATYLGGSQEDSSQSLVLDSGGNAWIAGYTSSPDFPTVNPVQAAFGGGERDAVLAKLDTSGALIFSTYFGGSAYDTETSLGADGAGNVIMSGLTNSPNIPTKNAVRPAGQFQEQFVAKFDSTGGLVYSTYLGGNDDDNPGSFAVDAAGNAYATGETYSTDFPLKNAVQTVLHGTKDLTITKFDPSGQIVYSTYLGSTDIDTIKGAGADSTGALVIVGQTGGGDFPVKNAYQPVKKGAWGSSDAFVTRFSPAGDVVYSTFFGGTGAETVQGAAVAANGSVVLIGTTPSTNFPTKYAPQPTYVGGSQDGFVARFDATGALVHSTFIGGSLGATPEDVTMDAAGNAYIVGESFGTGLPLRKEIQEEGAFQIFVETFDKYGNLGICTPFATGATGKSRPFSIRVDGAGRITIAGFTADDDFPTKNALLRDRTYPTSNGFVTKLDPNAGGLLLAIHGSNMVGNKTATGVVTLSPAPTGGAYVALTTDNPAVSIPSRVLVPAGKHSGSFTITTAGTPVKKTGVITATYGVSSWSARINVQAVLLQTFGIGPESVKTGVSTTGQLDYDAPTNDVTVSLSSSDPSVAQVPATVTLPAGSTRTTFTITTGSVTSDSRAAVTASVGDRILTATIYVTAIRIDSMIITPDAVTGGATAQATVMLNGYAPPGGVTATLSSSNPALTSIPSTITFPEGTYTKTFTINTNKTATDVQPTIYVQGPANLYWAHFVVRAQHLLSVTANPTSVAGGNVSTGTVTLQYPTGVGGETVNLKSSSAAASVPATVLVPEGASKADFPITAANVTVNTSAKVTATLGSESSSVSLVVTPNLKSLSAAPNSVIGGQQATATISLNGPAPGGGLAATATSTNPAASVPASMAIPAGVTNFTFAVSTSPVASVTSGILSVTVAGVTRTCSFSVKPPALSVLSFNPASVQQGQQTTGTVTLSGVAAADVTISLSSANPSVLAVPSSVTVPAGSSSATFTATAGAVTAATPVTVTASDTAGNARAKSVNVKP